MLQFLHNGSGSKRRNESAEIGKPKRQKLPLPLDQDLPYIHKVGSPHNPSPLYFWRNGKKAFRGSSFDAMDQLVHNITNKKEIHALSFCNCW